MVKTTPYQPISLAFVQKDRYCSGNTPTKTAQIAFMSRAYPRLRRPPRCCGHLSDAPGPLRYGGRVLAGAQRRPRWTGGTGRPVGWPGSRGRPRPRPLGRAGVAHATGVPKDQEERQAVRECDRREGAAESVGHRSLLRVFGGGVSSLTRDTRTPGHPGESAWTRRGETRGRTSRTCASPGAERSGAGIRRGHPRRHAAGRRARHDHQRPAVEHAVALLLRPPGPELTGRVGAVFDTVAARRRSSRAGKKNSGRAPVSPRARAPRRTTRRACPWPAPTASPRDY